LRQPACIAADTFGNVYIADAGNHFVSKFDPQGTPLLSYQDEKLRQPQSITVDTGGAIYVTDSGRHSAFVYSPNGDRYRQLRLKTSPKSEDILSIAVGDDGLIHILDADAGRVFAYTPRFRLVQTWQPAANVPNREARAKAVATSSDGYLYLADPGGNRILRFTREGRFVAAVDATADGTDRRLSDQFAVAHNHIFVMDTDGRTLHVWSTDGRPKADVDLAPELGQASRPAPALAVSPRQELLVLDAPGARVLRYRINFW
jgi:DNA-binding beta-propeller fold protein YncE